MNTTVNLPAASRVKVKKVAEGWLVDEWLEIEKFEDAIRAAVAIHKGRSISDFLPKPTPRPDSPWDRWPWERPAPYWFQTQRTNQ